MQGGAILLSQQERKRDRAEGVNRRKSSYYLEKELAGKKKSAARSPIGGVG